MCCLIYVFHIVKFTAQQNEVNGFLLFRMLLGVRVRVKFESHLHIGLLLITFQSTGMNVGMLVFLLSEMAAVYRL